MLFCNLGLAKSFLDLGGFLHYTNKSVCLHTSQTIVLFVGSFIATPSQYWAVVYNVVAPTSSNNLRVCLDREF